MATLALLLGIGYVVVVFIVEPLRLRRRTGASGWVASLGATAAETTASAMFLLGCGLELSNPTLVLADVALPRVAFRWPSQRPRRYCRSPAWCWP